MQAIEWERLETSKSFFTVLLNVAGSDMEMALFNRRALKSPTTVRGAKVLDNYIFVKINHVI